MTTEEEPMIFADETIFQENEEKETLSIKVEPWKILVVDDDEEIHSLTKLVLSDYSFENRPLMMLHAYSAEEAIKQLKTENDIALILLDVVMETDHAGLDCVKTIRKELENQIVRIILRTGQPGQAPERNVIVDYDINDYKAKTELTSQKLFTVVTASLRSYKHIRTINQNKLGLENIIAASGCLFELQSFTRFATGILLQLTSILQLDKNALYLDVSSLSALKESNDAEYRVLAATGDYSNAINGTVNDILPEIVRNRLLIATSEQESVFTENTYTGYFETKKGEHTLLYLQWQRTLSEIDRNLISIFASNIAIAFENVSLNREIIATQKEVIFTLSEVVEGRSKETANHIRRVAAVSCMLAKNMGMSEQDIELIRLASPMHDIGKVATPDSILKKRGKLTHDEYEIMKKHTTTGHNILKNSPRKMMVTADIIAYQHHEKWNGTGYPQGLKGEEIHPYARITALADVVDALANKRCYKKAWDMDMIVKVLREERGEHFEPQVVDLFLDHLNDFEKIQHKYPS